MTAWIVLFAHWVADFVFQSNYMAQNKSKSNAVLALHVAVYSSSLFACVALLMHLAGNGSAPARAWAIWAVGNGIAHFVVDWFTSRASSRLWAAKEVHWFFVVIGFDQLLHTGILLWTLPN